MTDRPDQTEASSVVPKGSFQWEAGLVVMNTEMDDHSMRSIAAPSNLVRIGVTKWFELRVFNQYETIKDRSSEEKNRLLQDLMILKLAPRSNYFKGKT